MGKTAFIFPGQGAQAVGMGKDLYQRYASASAVFETAGEAVQKLCFEGPQAELDKTINAQPCLFSAGLACASALVENGVRAQGAAGFSLGEVPAMAFCGGMSRAQAFAFVRFRAGVMQECAARRPGGMLAVIGLEAPAVITICEGIEGAYPANFNSPQQTVVAFAESALEALKTAVAAAGGRAVRLAAGGAFHSPFMDDAAAEIAEYLKTAAWGGMEIPLYSNVTAQVYGPNPAELLARQVNRPVLWRETIENMIRGGFDTFIETGPGKVLAGLVKKINKDVRVYSVYDIETMESVIETIGR